MILRPSSFTYQLNTVVFATSLEEPAIWPITTYTWLSVIPYHCAAVGAAAFWPAVFSLVDASSALPAACNKHSEMN